jgi:hypothetical protein
MTIRRKDRDEAERQARLEARRLPDPNGNLAAALSGMS